jgi:CheY-like chemotaxis protein
MQPDAAAGRHVVLTVTDTGTGIPAALREKIWDPFFTTKEQGKGTGLGLATTLSIVRSHGGFITMHSAEGTGTIFRVFLPARECSTVPAAEPADARGNGDDPNDLRGHGEVILVVDDEAPLLSVMRHSLQFFGYRVLTATNGAEGVLAYAENTDEIKVVITDMVMPVMDGPAMIAEIKTRNPGVKVIATTGMSSAVSIQTIQRLGVDRIIAKPCATKVILLALREVIGEPATN